LYNPFIGFARITQEIAAIKEGRKKGAMINIPRIFPKGTLVLAIIQANDTPRKTAKKVEVPATMNVLANDSRKRGSLRSWI